jgi:hypothetical protein
VILGDAVELMERRPQRAMEIAEPVIAAIGRRLGRDKEVIVVPGNHDQPFVRSWVWKVRNRLDVATPVPPDCTPALRAFTSWLAPAQVRVSYPGVWLSPGVWATHGHYLDVHLVPLSSYGFARGALRRMPDDRASPFDYELRRRRRSQPPRHRKPVSWVVEEAGGRLHSATSAVIKHRLMRPRYAALNQRLLRAQVDHAGLPALARVVHRLGVEADWVVYGHCHRLGPLAGDDRAWWQGPNGSPRLLNTGSWLYEPLAVQGVRPPNPYWPGGAVLIEPGQEPRAVGLLDDVGADALRTDVRPAID